MKGNLDSIPLGSPERAQYEQCFVDQVALQLKAKLAELRAYSLNEWLEEYHCLQWADAIRNAGVDSLLVLYDIDPADVEELATTIGMPKLKAKSFVRNCSELHEEVRSLKDRIKVRELRSGSVIVIFDILPPPRHSTTKPAHLWPIHQSIVCCGACSKS